MNVLSPQIAKMKQYRNWMIDQLASYLPESVIPNPPGMGDVPMLPSTYQDVGRNALNFLVPQPEDTLIAPAELRPNFRSPQQIQALRRLMAEEQRARGPINISNQTTETIWHQNPLKDWVGKEFDPLTHKQYSSLYNIPEIIPYKSIDPIDQILRGSWYHGMSEKARQAVRSGEIGEGALYAGLKEGFPISRHDAQSVSNKLGEPAGISLSLNPTVSGKFASDENIFRVMPLYGGPPTQRTVNLMTQEGRNALNDAYDVVANNYLSNEMTPWFKKDLIPRALRDYFALPENKGMTGFMSNQGSHTGIFNEALSNQLQSQGYRGILYNPKRWDEYEMLMLDPKYALPLDYRNVESYLNPVDDFLAARKIPAIDEAFGITPKAQNAISSIGDVMAQNKSRLGDIYAERSWWDRLTPEVKEILLQDNPYNEQIIKKLKGEQ